MNREPREVLTPLAACMLFGKSAEAVRRAVAEGHVMSPVALAFGAQPIRLLDLQSAVNYWLPKPRPEYLPRLESALAEMRLYGITFAGQIGNIVDDAIADDPLSRYRVLHAVPLVVRDEL